jgi:hypothetical protein
MLVSLMGLPFGHMRLLFFPHAGTHVMALRSAPWLASGTASGLVRIDWLQGRWFRGAIPYTSISNIRFEGQPLEGQTSDSE